MIIVPWRHRLTSHPPRQTSMVAFSMEAHPYGWLSLFPSLVAIILAIATRRVVIALLISILTGALITNQYNVTSCVSDALTIHLWRSLSNPQRLQVFAFTLLMGAMVGVIQRCGGMQGLIDLISPWAKNRQRGQVTTWFLGLLIFFDDYANTVLLGNTLRPLCERLRISREKLAYIVDSTAAPVAGLTLVSTWVAGELSFIQDGLNGLPVHTEVKPLTLFLGSMPYRFYVIWALAFVFLVGFMQRDFGPMLKAERNAATQERGTNGMLSSERGTGWWNAVVPIMVTVIAVLFLLHRSGSHALATGGSTQPSLQEIFGEADSYFALFWGSIIGFATAAILACVQRHLTLSGMGRAAISGANVVLPAIVILWLASALSEMTGNGQLTGYSPADPTAPFPARDYRLYTGEFLASLVSSEAGGSEATLRLMLPSVIFALSAAISFATGTSWGTMAIVMPIAIPLAHGVISADPSVHWSEHPVMLCTIGGVLAGSIFGDHCSPISDTTVLSSQACGCEHTAHVWTQLPYALAVGAVSILLGTLPVALGAQSWVVLPLGVVALAALLRLLGQRTDGLSSFKS